MINIIKNIYNLFSRTKRRPAEHDGPICKIKGCTRMREFKGRQKNNRRKLYRGKCRVCRKNREPRREKGGKRHIFVTAHANSRFIERWRAGGTVLSVANDALEHGRKLSYNKRIDMFERGIINGSQLTHLYKVYKGHLFVFDLKKGKYTLITLYPY